MTQEQAIEEIARRLVEHYRPERIYRDLDFCVVLPDDAPEELFRGGAIYSMAPHRFRCPRRPRCCVAEPAHL